MAAKQKPALTLNKLEAWLTENGITIRHNVISHGITVSGVSSEYNPETINNDLHIIVHDILKREYACDRSLVADLLAVIAGKHRYNPVVDMLAAAPPWDGVDRMPEVYRILHIPENDTLSRRLIHKWLLQTRSIVENEIQSAFGADGVLVLERSWTPWRRSGCGKAWPIKSRGRAAYDAISRSNKGGNHMSKRYEITIKDNTDGKVRTLEGDFYLLSIPNDEGCRSESVGRASSVDVVRCLMGVDFQREKLFKIAPAAAALYEHRDLAFSYGGTIDVVELERQLGKDIGS